MNSKAPIDFDPPGDDLYRHTELRHVCEAQVLGIPVRFESNSGHVLDAVEQSFGEGERVGTVDRRVRQPRVRVFLQEGDEGASERIPIRHRWPEPDRLVISTPGSVGVAEVDRREAFAFVTTALASNIGFFRYSVLEALTLMLVTSMDRQPLHAAAIMRDGLAVLLVGPSGSGKSTLTYAALAKGWRLLAEEAVYVQLKADLRVWGMPSAVRLPEGSDGLFPELQGRPAEWLPNGKRKIVVPVEPAPGPRADSCDRPVVCVIEPDGDEVGLRSAAPEEIERALTSEIDQGFDMNLAATRVVAARLAEPGGWVLSRGGHPATCVALLDGIVEDPV